VQKRSLVVIAALFLQLASARADEGTWQPLWRFDTHG